MYPGLPYPYIRPQNDNLFLHHHHSLISQQPQHQHSVASVDRTLPTLRDYYCSAAAENSQATEAAAAAGQAYPIPAPLPHQPRKKVAKRDRHSKINTAQGPRDRRMRLSLEIAREFFDLQDTLGFDKASKTVEWLLVNSRAAIHELSRAFLPHADTSASRTASSTSECQVASATNGIDYQEDPWRQVVVKTAPARVANAKRSCSKKAAVVREARARARARARDRTKQKCSLRVRCDMSGGGCGGGREDDYGTALSKSKNTSGGQQLGSSPDKLFEDSWSPSTIFGSHFHLEVSSHRNSYVADQSNWDTHHQHHIGFPSGGGGISNKTITDTQLHLETPVCGGAIPLEDNYSSFVNITAATKAAAAVQHQFLGLHFDGKPGWDAY